MADSTLKHPKEAISGSSYHPQGWEKEGKGLESEKHRRLRAGLVQLVLLSSEEGSEQPSHRPVLMLPSEAGV